MWIKEKKSTIRCRKDGIPENTHRFQDCTVKIKGHMGERKKKRVGQRTQNLYKTLIKTVIDTQGNNLDSEGRQRICGWGLLWLVCNTKLEK